MPTPTALGYVMQPPATGGSVGPNIDLLAVTGPGSVTYARQVGSWGDPSTWAAIAGVINVPPVDNEYGIVTRSIAAGCNTAIVTSQTTVGTSATQISSGSSNAQRRVVVVSNGSGGPIFVGPSGVTALNGYYLAAGDSVRLELGPALALYAISPTGSSSTAYVVELS